MVLPRACPERTKRAGASFDSAETPGSCKRWNRSACRFGRRCEGTPGHSREQRSGRVNETGDFRCESSPECSA